MSDVMFQGHSPNVYNGFQGTATSEPSTVVPSYAYGGSQGLFVSVRDPAGLAGLSATGNLVLDPPLAAGATSYDGFLALPLDVNGVRPPISPGRYVLTATDSNQQSSVAPVVIAGMTASIASISGTFDQTTRAYAWSITLNLSATLGLNRIERIGRAVDTTAGETLMEVKTLTGQSAQATFTGSGVETTGNAGVLDAMVFDADGNSVRFSYFVDPNAILTGTPGGAFVGPNSGTQFETGSYVGVTVPLGAGVTIKDLITDGAWNVDLALGPPSRAPSGWKAAGTASYFIVGLHPTATPPTISVPFISAGLSAGQTTNARIGRTTYGAERMGVDVMTPGSASGALTVLTSANGGFTPIVTKYENPGFAVAAGGAEILYDASTAGPVSLALVDPSDSVAADLRAQASLLGYNLQGSLYLAGPHGATFNPPAYITLPGAEANHDGVLVIELSQGQAPRILPAQDRNDPARITAQLDFTASYFGLFTFTPPNGGGSSGGSGSADLTPPVTTLGFSGAFASTAGAAGLINERSSVTLTAVDAGVGQVQTFYAVDPSSAVLTGGLSAGTTGAFLVYASGFSLPPGRRVVAYGSVDGAGNYEVLRSTAVEVENSARSAPDVTPPVTTLGFNGYSVPVAGAAAFIYDTSSVEFFPVEHGSGLTGVFYAVDPSSAILAAGLNAGTTSNFQIYTGTFSLTPGLRIIAYGSVDVAGNYETLQSTAVEVGLAPSGGGAPASSGMGIGKDPFDALWTVILDNNAPAFARVDAAGALLSSTTLPDAAVGFPWSVFFDPAGRAYAIGIADGLSTQAADLAVYKASPAGNAVESRTLFDSGYANNDIVLDAKSPGWVVGGAQTSGPVDFAAPGGRSFAMALWKFDPALGSVQLATTSVRAAFDIGTGVAVDADASLWISGYSLRPDAPAAFGFDLALWHYAADGRTLLGGPFLWPGYLSDFDGSITARVHVSGGSVYIAAPRMNAAVGTDMAFLRFDKVTSRTTSESAWRSVDGSTSYPVAILPEATGLLVAGGIGSDATQATLWRFGYDGVFRSASVADAGGAQGAVFKGSELWLSVDGSTVPYRVSSASPAAGALIDISTPAASAPPATSLQINDLTVSATALVLVSTDSLGFIAFDAGAGVLETRYALDDGTEIVFSSTFSLAAGTHTLAYRSLDLAGNAEKAKVVSLTVFGPDVTPPALALTPPNGSTMAVATPAIVASYSDLGRGVDPSTVRLVLDGSDVTSLSAVTASSATFVPGAALSQTVHAVSARVADFAGNWSSADATFLVDSIPPATMLLMDGLSTTATSLILVSTNSLSFAASDTGSGVLHTRYALDGSTVEVVFASTFSLTPGAHALAFHSVDLAGNVEPLETVSLAVQAYDATAPSVALTPVNLSTVTSATPAIVAAYSDIGRGIDVSSVRLFLDGVDVTAQAAVTASSAVFAPSSALAQGKHTAAAQVADLAGNRASAASTFLLDSVAPVTTLLINGLAAGDGTLVLSSTDTVGFAASDAGTGVLETRYSLEGAAEGTFVSTFTLSAGRRSLAFRSRDRAGNLEPARTVSISVTSPFTDTAPPLVRLDFPGAVALGVEQALGGVINVRGGASDASALAWTLEAAPGASATGGFATLASGAGNLSGFIAAWNTASLSGDQTLRLRATDAFGNTASVATTVFIGSPVFTFAVGRKDSNTIISTIKGPTGIAVRSDGAVWVASTENDNILLISPAGVLLGEAGHAPGRSGEAKERGKKDKDDGEHDHGDDEDAGGLSFKTPQGLALDAAGNLYVADRDLDRVVKLSPDGQVLLLALGKRDGQGRPKSGSGPGELRHPFDVAVDDNGDIYAADSGNRRVQVFDASGAFLRQFGQDVLLSTSEIRGIALTSEGLWVSDKELEVIHLFSRSGALIKTIGGADSVVGELSRTRGLAADRLGGLYVVEPNRDRVQKFDPRGKGLLAFGSKAGLGLADKKAKRYLTQPIDAAVAPDGSIWITDAGRDRIVRYALPVPGGNAGGSAVTTSAVEPARRVVEHKDGATVSRDDGAGVRVPKGALAADLEITVEKGDENQDKEQKEAKRRELKIKAVSEEVQYGPEGTTFNTPVTLTVPYDAGLVASLGIKEDDLKVYYWNPGLKEWQPMPSTVDKQSKAVNAQTNHFSAYQVGGLGGISAAAVDDFGLRDGYAFPNPSSGGSAVTFRMQPGSADSIEVRVYDVSGRKVHSSSDFRFRGAIDDGNGKGLQNTYDHVWDVSGIGSGVYSFVITAKKAGEADAHKTGKVGVIK